jgi:nucleotide-binding universal stress UspA family protein
MSDKILVPLDGSKLAEVALLYAEELARRLGYQIIMINVRSPAEDPYHAVLQSYVESKVDEAKHNIRTGLAKHRGKVTKVAAILVGSGILVGHPAEEIVDYAEKKDIDLIVMATHGRTGIRRWALGSVTNKVVRNTRRPVMLVRAQRAHADARQKVRLDKILVPLDGSKQSETIIPYVENLASRLKAGLVLLHVIAQPYHVYAGTKGVVEVPYTKRELKMKKASAKNYLENLGRVLRSKGIRTKTQVGVGEAAEEIIKLAEELNTDIVVMSTHGRSGFSRWEHGSVADKVLHAGNTPLLLVRGPIEKGDQAVLEAATQPQAVKSLVGDLASKDDMARVKARRALVAVGNQAVGPLVRALASKKHWVRWEAAKALGQIGNPAATQALVDALEDQEFDVRWLAAEGLIHIGAKVIEPLLKALTERPDSLWLREGAHHVLHDLPEPDLKEALRPVLRALEDVEPSVEAASAAKATLEIIERLPSQIKDIHSTTRTTESEAS